MKDRISLVARRIFTAFGSFTPGQKAVTILGVLVIAIGGYLFATWAARPSYAPLFSNLSSADASAIVDKLSATGTPYQLTEGGTTILVPQSQVYDVRLKMSGQGLPAQADTGYALLDKQGITTSEFMQNVDYQRALEGELAKTIKSINGVTSATVHLAIPQKDIFADDAQQPTASVLVASTVGSTPTQDQVQAIVHLVASSVVGLAPNQVTVAGSDGTVLSTGGGQDPSSGGTGGRAGQTSDFEHRMNLALEQMLASVVGTGHVVVNTTADLDYDNTQTKTQTYVAPSPSTPPISQTNNSETYSGSGSGVGGVLGPDNIQVPNGTAGGAGNYSHSTNTQDNAVGLVTETRNSAPGNVRRLSVAVLLDSNTAKNLNMGQIQTLISSAVALTPSRGDTIAVSALPFDQTKAADAKTALAQSAKAGKMEQLLAYAKTGVLVLAILLLLFMAWRASRRAKKAQLTADELAQLERVQTTIEAKRGALAGAGAGGAAALEAPAAAVDDLDYRAEFAKIVERQPENVAQVLRDWLAESRRG
jgi:flagellar M-ring protein FliF